MKRVFLVDGENHVNTGIVGIDMLLPEDVVLIFHRKGAPLTKIKAAAKASKASISYVESVKEGKNSLDFQIIAELGVLIGKDETDYAYIISQDQGYLPSIQSLCARYSNIFKEIALKPSIEECLKLAFVMKSQTKQELHTAFVREYGVEQGSMIYNHLKQIFSANDLEKPAASKQCKAAEENNNSSI